MLEAMGLAVEHERLTKAIATDVPGLVEIVIAEEWHRVVVSHLVYR